MRWQHPERGLLYPGAFLPVVEQTGLMRPLTLNVLEQALAQCARWRREGIDIPVAINLAAANLLDLALADDIDRLLERYGLDSSMLELEITERIMAADPVRINTVLDEFAARGIVLALDDFGTGSSSLSYLRQLPVQELKIDKSFVNGSASGDERDAAVIRTIIRLAQDLGLRSVAEGIESDAMRAQLTAWGCEQGQGSGSRGRPRPRWSPGSRDQARSRPSPSAPEPGRSRSRASAPGQSRSGNHGPCQPPKPLTSVSEASGPHEPFVYGWTGGASSSSGCMMRHVSSTLS